MKLRRIYLYFFFFLLFDNCVSFMLSSTSIIFYLLFLLLRSRINAYKALASPSLICLSSKDPILTSFELSCELKQLSKLENEFKADYERLAARCQEFAVDLLEQTRGSRELAIVLNHDNSSAEEQNNDKVRLSRLKLAIKYKQKKVSGCWG